tara:strand:- start:287 stop:517 length:231 start_codon:yes stop_codon:yes gene_type:complete
MGQVLSREARAAKKIRDLKAANERDREIKRAQNQKKDRQEGTEGDGLDRHHTKNGRIIRATVKANRGFFGKGTKNE